MYYYIHYIIIYIPYFHGFEVSISIVSSLISCLSEVWEQGTFNVDFQHSEDKFQRAISENPSTLHEFLVAWSLFVLYFFESISYDFPWFISHGLGCSIQIGGNESG